MWPTWRGTHPVLLKTIMSVTFALTIPKFFVVAIQLVDELLRAAGVWTWLKVSGKPTEGAMARGSFLNVLGPGLGRFGFMGMGYGITKGKYAYKVRDIKVVRIPTCPRRSKA